MQVYVQENVCIVRQERKVFMRQSLVRGCLWSRICYD